MGTAAAGKQPLEGSSGYRKGGVPKPAELLPLREPALIGKGDNVPLGQSEQERLQ